MPTQAFTNMYKNMADMKPATPDMGEVAATMRRNAEAASAAGQVLAESAQTVARRGMDTLRQNMEFALETSREILTSQSPEQNINRQAQFARTAMESAMGTMREMSDLFLKSSFEAATLVQKRLSDSFSELQGATSKKAS